MRKVKGKAIIYNVDTDILVNAVHHYKYYTDINQMWIETSISAKHRFIPVHEIVNNLDPSLSSVLLAVHTLTGSDGTAAPYYKGKKTAMKLIQKKKLTWDAC